MSNTLKTKLTELGAKTALCTEMAQNRKYNNKHYNDLKTHVVGKENWVKYDKETRQYVWDTEIVGENPLKSYNDKLKIASEKVSDPKIKELMLQGASSKPKALKINKVADKAIVKIEAIAPLGGTYFTIGLKCEQKKEVS